MAKIAAQYVCEHCGNFSHAEQNIVEKHEKKCIATIKHHERGEKRHNEACAVLDDIRKTSQTMSELTTRVSEFVKEMYDIKRFVFDISTQHYYTGDKRTYIISLKMQYHLGVKRKNYPFMSWSREDELVVSDFLKHLRIYTGSGSGDGKVYSYSAKFDINDFPGIRRSMMELGTASNVLRTTEEGLLSNAICSLHEDPVVDQLIEELKTARDRLIEANAAYEHALENLRDPLKTATTELEKKFDAIPTEHLRDPITGASVTKRSRSYITVNDIVEPLHVNLISQV